MKFADVEIGVKFTLGDKDTVYEKTETIRANCCTVQQNCIIKDTGESYVVANDTEIRLV